MCQERSFSIVRASRAGDILDLRPGLGHQLPLFPVLEDRPSDRPAGLEHGIVLPRQVHVLLQDCGSIGGRRYPRGTACSYYHLPRPRN